MKIFISADMEGITGVTSWCETEQGGQGYNVAAIQMAKEVSAACEAALELGYEVVVKDAHDTARNIDPSLLPEQVQLIRGWDASPASMMEGLDETFAGVIYVGYHAGAGNSGNPLSHTMSDSKFNWMKVNGCPASEFLLNTYWAAGLGVPVFFISGDQGICDEAMKTCSEIETVAVKRGMGDATWNIHPRTAERKIKEGVKAALCKGGPRVMEVSDSLTLEICYSHHQSASKASWYPGAMLVSENIVSFTAKNPKEMFIAKMFMEEV